MSERKIQSLTEAHDDAYRIVFENNSAIALHNYTPIMNYHCIVIPKRNVQYLSDLTADEAKDILDLIEKVSIAVSKCSGFDTIVLKNEGQHITYPEKLHIHIIPSEYKFGELYVKVSSRDLSATQRDRTIRSKDELTRLTDNIKRYL
jgi:diadenosine tetraphosphate (Ap4A) HIT family hydrolase